MRGSVAWLGIAGAAEAGEDLSPQRVVPVAEARPGDDRVGDPGAAAQDAVVGAEEDLGVLRVRERLETRIAAEKRAGPLPHSSLHVLDLVRIGARGLLP